jgi:hypothetical protein
MAATMLCTSVRLRGRANGLTHTTQRRSPGPESAVPGYFAHLGACSLHLAVMPKPSRWLMAASNAIPAYVRRSRSGTAGTYRGNICTKN